MLNTVKAAIVKAAHDPTNARSKFSPRKNTIFVGWEADELTVVHELMHAVGAHDIDFHLAEERYFKDRTASKKTKTLRDITGDMGYRTDEIAYDMGGNCIDPYVFKDYGGGAYELMSMGVETLYRSPVAYSNDPNMLKWVLSMLGRFGAK